MIRSAGLAATDTQTASGKLAVMVRWRQKAGSAGSRISGCKDVAAVGGKTASLGELHALLGGRVPDGFALTAQAYRDALAAAGVEDELRRLLSGFDHHDVALLAERAAAARRLVYEATGNAAICARRLPAAYRALEQKCGAQGRGRSAQLGHCRGSADRQLCRAARELSQCARRRRRWSRPAGAASPRSLPTAPSSIASTTASIISRWRCRSAS